MYPLYDCHKNSLTLWGRGHKFVSMCNTQYMQHFSVYYAYSTGGLGGNVLASTLEVTGSNLSVAISKATFFCFFIAFL